MSSGYQTAFTMSMIIVTVGAYILQLFGAYSAQQNNLTKQEDGRIQPGYVIGGATLNSMVTMYLIFYLFNYSFKDSYGDLYKVLGAFILITIMAVDIYLAGWVLDLPNKDSNDPGKNWEKYGWIYGIGSLSFLIRLWCVVKFQCSDLLTAKYKLAYPPAPAEFKKPNFPPNPNPTQPRSSDTGKFIPKSEAPVGGKHRRR